MHFSQAQEGAVWDASPLLFYFLSKSHSQAMLSVIESPGGTCLRRTLTLRNMQNNNNMSPTWHVARDHGDVEGLEEHARNVEAVELLDRRCTEADDALLLLLRAGAS